MSMIPINAIVTSMMLMRLSSSLLLRLPTYNHSFLETQQLFYMLLSGGVLSLQLLKIYD